VFVSQQNGTLDKFNVELLGAKLPSINRAEDRNLFKEAMTRIGLKTPQSGIANTMEEALKVQTLPCGVPHDRSPAHQHLFRLLPAQVCVVGDMMLEYLACVSE
jgi:hypothetical protein